MRAWGINPSLKTSELLGNRNRTTGPVQYYHRGARRSRNVIFLTANPQPWGA